MLNRTNKYKNSWYKRNLSEVKSVVKSFRAKNDPYLRLISQYELQKDAQQRDDMGYEVLLNNKK